MKTKISHLGRSSVSVILAVMMLLSTMLIGTVSTVNAADLSNATKVYLDSTLATVDNNKLNTWSSIYAYAFKDGGVNTYTDQNTEGKNSWHGSVMYNEGNGIYSIYVDNSATNIIFNNNDNKQTGNLTLPDDWKTTPMIYYGDGSNGPNGWKTYSASPTYKVTYGVNGGNGALSAKGVSSSGSTVNSGTKVTFTATPNEGYAVEGWYRDVDCKNAITDAETNTSYEVIVNANTNVYVKFKSSAPSTKDYYVRGTFNDWKVLDDYKMSYTNGVYSLTLTKMAAKDYDFKLFYNDGSEHWFGTSEITNLSSEGCNLSGNGDIKISNLKEVSNITFTYDGNTTLKVVAESAVNKYTVTYDLGTDSTGKGSVSAKSADADIASGAQVEGDKSVTFTANPNKGYAVEGWYSDAGCTNKIESAGTNKTYTVTVNADTNVYVKFRTANTYTVNFSSSNETYGTVSATNGTNPLDSDTKVTEGDTVTFTATPSSGYTFTGWTVNGASAPSTDNPYTITVNKDTTVVANFNTGTLSGYYLLCGEDPTFKVTSEGSSYKSVPLYKNEKGEYYADFDAANITKKKDYYIIFSTKEDTSGIIVETNNVTINTVDNNGFSLGSRNDNVQNPNGGSNNVKFAKVYINSDDVTGFTIKITGLDLDKKKITYSAEPKFDVAPADTVEITAKDGTIRAGFTDTDAGKTTAVLGDTTLSITTPDGEVITASDSYEIDGKNRAVTAKKVPNGSTVTVTTKINPEATFAGHKGSDYYVKGFSVNGIFGGVLSQTEGKSHSDNTYEYTFKVNQEIYNSQKLEITPVYFLKDDTNCVYFYIENYDSAKQVWGNTPSCYVYYANGASALAALGYYPGQPMVDYNGSIFTQIPKSIVNDGGTQKSITGMTLNNYVWDDVHRAYNNIEDPKAVNAQTYDYDDFVKIAESGAAADNIIYRFKYNKFDNKPQATLAASEADPAGWEVFLDYQNYPTDIFGNKIGNVKLDYKDTDSVKNNGDYLSIISNGYEKNYIGNYATSWSIYNKAGERVANIPSSALLYALGKDEAYMKTAINSDSIPDDFLPGKSNRESYWTEFKNLYTNYKDVPAQINFEASIKSGDDPGDRLDGRWYYSQSKETITGEIKIQYANTLDDYNTNNFHDDKFDDDKPTSIVGKTTGASAYFTDPKDKVRKLETVADNTQDYKFVVNATSTATYTFVGWYRLIDGDYKAINPSDVSSLTGAVTRNSDVTLVARYIKTPGGSMTFHHSLYNGTDAGGGKATTEIRVVVTDSENEVIYDSGKIAGTASIDKTKITELATQAGLTVTVTLYTTTKNLYNFNGYYSAENTTDITAFAPTTDFTTNVTGNRTDGLVTKSEYKFSFNDYYNKYADILTAADAGTVYYNFYSDITSIKVPYKVQFSYIDRMGAQKYYNKAGYVDPENTSSYTFVETNGEGSNAVEVTLTNSFILSLAPYESNFTKKLTWNETPDSNIAFDSSITNSIATAVVNSTQSDRTIRLNVFRDDNGNPTPLENTAGKFVLYEKGGSTELPYNSVFYKPNGDGTYIYDITAPKTYKDNGKELQFMYWAIYSDAECKNLVIKAYNIDGGFSYVSYDNYWIVPVYGASSTPSASVKEVSTSTQFMEVTRNQWTAADNNTFNGFDADDMTTLDTADDFIKGNDEDKLYADFVLNFFYNGKQLSVFDPNSKKVQTGIVMQKLALDEDSTGVGYITDMKHYADKYTKAELSAAAEDAKNKILKKETTIESLTKQIDNSRLSNKNRIQYYARFNNTEANANYVYRVYTYIKYVNESNETIIELGEPIYFTLYDVANKTV